MADNLRQGDLFGATTQRKEGGDQSFFDVFWTEGGDDNVYALDVDRLRSVGIEFRIGDELITIELFDPVPTTLEYVNDKTGELVEFMHPVPADTFGRVTVIRLGNGEVQTFDMHRGREEQQTRGLRAKRYDMTERASQTVDAIVSELGAD